MEYEQVTILLLVSSHVLITPFVLSRSLRIALPALALLGSSYSALAAGS